jgi:hypothetical protein
MPESPRRETCSRNDIFGCDLFDLASSSAAHSSDKRAKPPIWNDIVREKTFPISCETRILISRHLKASMLLSFAYPVAANATGAVCETNRDFQSLHTWSPDLMFDVQPCISNSTALR